MPQRAVNLVLALAGVAAVVLIVVLGVNLARASRRGPKWKRRLLSAGIGLMAALGVTTVDTGCFMCYAPVPTEFREGSIGRVRYRLRLLDTFVQRRDVTPLALENALKSLQADLDELTKDEAAGKLSDKQRAEAKELREQADRLIKEVQSQKQETP